MIIDDPKVLRGRDLSSGDVIRISPRFDLRFRHPQIGNFVHIWDRHVEATVNKGGPLYAPFLAHIHTEIDDYERFVSNLEGNPPGMIPEQVWPMLGTNPMHYKGFAETLLMLGKGGKAPSRESDIPVKKTKSSTIFDFGSIQIVVKGQPEYYIE